MKAMLYADWMNLRQMIKSLLFVLVIFAISAFLWSGSAFLNMIVVMLSVMVPNTLCSVDKAYSWDRLSLSLPILRREVVASKFLLSGLINGAALLLSCVLAAIYCLSDSSEPALVNISALLISEAIALVLMGVDLCVIYKKGVEKARYILMACVWIPIIVVFLISKINLTPPDLSWIDRLSEMNLIVISGALAVVGLVVYLICYQISVSIYQKAEL